MRAHPDCYLNSNLTDALTFSLQGQCMPGAMHSDFGVNSLSSYPFAA